MVLIPVYAKYPADPPPDLVGIDKQPWYHWTTGEANAWVLQTVEGRFLLHRIESRTRGHGRRLMDCINAWADDQGLEGGLVCDESVVGFYEKCGWYTVGNYGDTHTYEMRREPQ